MVSIKQRSSGVEKGSRFGTYTAIGCPFSCGDGVYRVVMQCDCGRVEVRYCSQFRKRRAGYDKQKCASCAQRKRQLRHGDANKTCRLYRTWASMIQRCENSKCHAFRNYGARGISVCELWRRDYTQFREWSLRNGFDDSLEIDRIDNDGNYEPSNCRWTTRKRNASNRRGNRIIEAFGESKTMTEWSEDARSPVGWACLQMRLNRGWLPEEAIITPINGKRKLCV